MKKILLILCVLFAVSGCTFRLNPGNSDYTSETQHGTISMRMAENLTAQEQLLLSHAITAHNIYTLEVVEQQSIDERRDDYTGLIKFFAGCATMIVCIIVMCGAVLLRRDKKWKH